MLFRHFVFTYPRTNIIIIFIFSVTILYSFYSRRILPWPMIAYNYHIIIKYDIRFSVYNTREIRAKYLMLMDN